MLWVHKWARGYDQDKVSLIMPTLETLSLSLSLRPRAHTNWVYILIYIAIHQHKISSN